MLCTQDLRSFYPLRSIAQGQERKPLSFRRVVWWIRYAATKAIPTLRMRDFPRAENPLDFEARLESLDCCYADIQPREAATNSPQHWTSTCRTK